MFNFYIVAKWKCIAIVKGDPGPNICIDIFFSMKEITVKKLKKFKEMLRNHEIKMVER